MSEELLGSTSLIHPNLKKLSESSLKLFHGCPRRFQLYRLFGSMGITEEGENENLLFGSAVGAGSQELFISGDMDKAILATALAWEGYLDDDLGARSKKTIWHAIEAVQRFYEFRHSTLSEYDVLLVDGKPASELGYVVDCGDGFQHRGFLDLLLVHRRSGDLLVFEGKTTKYSNLHEAVYKNSSQGLGYDIIVEAIAKKIGIAREEGNYDVFYAVYKTGSGEWQDFRFPKSNSSRAMWIKQLLREIQHISEYALDAFFPRHGDNCYNFFRPCPYLDLCNLSDESLRILPEQVAVSKDDDSKYTYRFTIEELITAQLERYGETAE